MKKIYTLLCIAATMLAACAKENLVENDTTPQDEDAKYVDVSFDAEFPVPAELEGLQNNAKTMLNSDLSVSWSEGDQIAVNCDGTNWDGDWKTNIYLATFNSTINKEDSHKATFTGTLISEAKKFVAIYPAANVKCGTTMGFASDGCMYGILPSSQEAKEGSFTNGCAISYTTGTVEKGQIKETSLNFTNLCSVLEFTMPDYVLGAQQVTIKSNDEAKISGGYCLDRHDFNFKSFEASSEKDETYDYVTVTAPNTANKFYAVIFPGNYSNGFKITVTTAGGQVYSRNVTKALKADANHIYNLGTLGVVLDEQKVTLKVDIEQNIQTGSVATFNIAANGDFKDMVKSWDINLYNSKDHLVRKIEGNTTGSGTLETVGDFKLLAAGEYYATVTYFMKTGSKRDALRFTGIKAPQFVVKGVVINATPTLNYSGNTLNGTDVELSFNTSAVDPDLAKHISWGEIKLVDANGADYRTATAAGKMTPASGKPYLPKGDYTLTAYFTLPELGCNDPTPLEPKTITVNLTPTFGVELTSAKTSYDYYKAGDINTANGCKNMGIYELAANVTGISDAVATQMAGKFSYEWFLDSNSLGKTENTNAAVKEISQNTDNAVKVAFGNKKVSCTATFEGGSAEGTKDVAITGLPYTMNTTVSQPDGWTKGGSMDSGQNHQIYSSNNAKLGKWTPSTSYCISPKFYGVDATGYDIVATMNCYAYGGSIPSYYKGIVYISTSESDSTANKVKEFTTGVIERPNTTTAFEDVSANLSFNSSVSNICIHVDGQRYGGTAGTVNIGVVSKRVTIQYR